MSSLKKTRPQRPVEEQKSCLPIDEREFSLQPQRATLAEIKLANRLIASQVEVLDDIANSVRDGSFPPVEATIERLFTFFDPAFLDHVAAAFQNATRFQSSVCGFCRGSSHASLKAVADCLKQILHPHPKEEKWSIGQLKHPEKNPSQYFENTIPMERVAEIRNEWSELVPKLGFLHGLDKWSVEFAMQQELAQAIRDAESHALLKSGQVSPPTDEFYFYLDGDGYFIQAFGESATVPIKDVSGLHDIARLLRSPNKPVEMLELEFGGPVEPLPGEKRTEQQMADSVTVAKLKADRIRLRKEIESAENDVERADSQRQLDAVTAEGRKMFDHIGQPRNMNDPWASARSPIRKRLNGAYFAIAIAGLPKLAQTLKPVINAAGDSYVYRAGDKPPKWQFSRDGEE